VRTPVWIEEREVLAIHEQLLVIHGGAPGLRDPRLLQSALARPQHDFAYDEKPDLVQMAAIYTGGLVQNHPFIDGNKRTGFLIGILFLELNRCHFYAREEEATQAVFALAAGEIKEDYAVFLRANTKRKRR
jgi:death on curing protein